MNIELLTKMRDVLREEAAGEGGLSKALPNVENPKLFLGSYIEIPNEDENQPHTRFCLAGLAALLSGTTVPEALDHDGGLHEIAMNQLGISEDVSNRLFFGGLYLCRYSDPSYCEKVLDHLIQTGNVRWWIDL